MEAGEDGVRSRRFAARARAPFEARGPPCGAAGCGWDQDIDVDVGCGGRWGSRCRSRRGRACRECVYGVRRDVGDGGVVDADDRFCCSYSTDQRLGKQKKTKEVNNDHEKKPVNEKFILDVDSPFVARFQALRCGVHLVRLEFPPSALLVQGRGQGRGRGRGLEQGQAPAV